MDLGPAIDQLTQTLGPEKVIRDPADLALFAGGSVTVGMLHLPGVVCRPDSVEDVVQI